MPSPDKGGQHAGRVTSAERWAEIRPIVEGALELPPGERDVFIDHRSGGDAKLRDEVERMVQACEGAAESSEFLAEPAAAAVQLIADVRARPGTVGEPMKSLVVELEGRYRIEREVGRGGMATVYLAHDRKHDRRVALKVLDPELGAILGGERFVAEIRVTANLQHPNLLPLFDSGEAGGLVYYVMPFVEGGSLRARLDREGQLPVDEAIRLTVAIAGALDYAHRHGVVHRDLKPANILLHDGEPLVADFGISLAASRVGGTRLTQSGIALGTPTYMSPEQATADRTVDGRSDVFSLACVLYEMLAGDPPHAASTMQAVLAKVLTEPTPSVRAVRPSVPAHVDAALERALAKVPADRFDTARAFAQALLAPGATPSVGVSVPAARAGRRDTLLIALGAAAILGLGSTAWLATRGRTTPEARPTRFVVGPLIDQALGSAVTITPDGRALVYTGPVEQGRPLLVRSLDQLQARALPGTEGAHNPFVSPDGRRVGYFTSDDKLETVPIDGGAPTERMGAWRYSNAAWTPDGAIVMETFGSKGLLWLAPNATVPRVLTRLDSARGESNHGKPFVLPGGRVVVFTVEQQRAGPGPAAGELAIATLDPGATGPSAYVRLGVSGRRPVAFRDGWLLYTGARGTELLAVRLDAERRRVEGSPVPVLQDASGEIGSAVLAADGTLVYVRRRTTSALVLVDGRGTARPLAGVPDGTYMNPRLSPDGRRLAIQATSARGNDVLVYDITSGTPTRLTTNGAAIGPAWTPDGRRIVFLSNQGGRFGFWWQLADGSTAAEPLVEIDASLAAAVAPDGRTLLFQHQTGDTWGIWSLSLESGRTPRAVLEDPSNYYMPAVSPDGGRLAYTSNASGRDEVYARPFPGPGAAVQVSDSGGTEPAWSPDGGRIFFRSGRRLVAATVATAPTLDVTARRALFEGTFEGEMPHRNYDVTPDGSHFVMVAAGSASAPEVVVVLDWLAELRERLARAR